MSKKSTKKNSYKAAIIGIGSIFAIGMIFVFFFFDNNLSTKQYYQDAYFVKMEETGSTGRSSIHVRWFYTFKLDDGSEIAVSYLVRPDSIKPQYKQNQKAKIFYRKGYFTKRIFYDGFEFYENPTDSTNEFEKMIKN